MRSRWWLVPALALGAATALLADQTVPDVERFVDVTKAAGVTFVHDQGPTPEKHMVETLGSGVAWIDYDNDGFPDLYFVNGARGSSNVLYRNDGDGTFTDVTARAGVAAADPRNGHKTGVAVGDIENDGDLDLFVSAFGPDILYRNNGNGTFTDISAAAGVEGGEVWGTSAGFFDYDRDGLLDLYVANYVDARYDDTPYCGYEREGMRAYCSPTIFDGTTDFLYHNDGNGTFTDVSAKAGIANPSGKGLGVVFCDYDDDAWVDVYVANDLVRNFLYRNNGDGTFRDVTYRAGVGFDANGKPQAGMGTDCGDVDGDHRPDLMVINLSDELNTLYVNAGEGIFEDRTIASGLGSGFGPLGFGMRMFDLDNDGDLDVHVVNGHITDNIDLYDSASTYRQKDLLYVNVGGGKFEDVSATSGAAFDVLRVGRGQAVADYDNDGLQDIAISNLGGQAFLLKNTGAGAGHWLSIRARGRRSNRFGLGARVTIETASGTQVREINNAASYESAHDTRLHVGVGAATVVDRIAIRWPSGAVQELTNVPVDRVMTIEEP